MSKYCVKCGTELPDNALFCRKCGARVEDVKIEEIEVTEKKEEVKQDIPINENKQKKEKLINFEALNTNQVTGIIVAAIVLVTVIIIISIIVVGKKNEKMILGSVEPKNQTIIDNNDVKEIMPPIDIKKYIDSVEQEIDRQGSEESSGENDMPEKTTPEYTEPNNGNSNTPNDSNSDSQAKKMTEEEFVLCWYNDQYLSQIPLIGVGNYETIVQAEKYSTAILSNISKNQVKLYCEQTGNEGDLDMNGFNVNAKVVADSNEGYSFQVSNKAGVTAYINWADNVALFIVGVD